MRSKIEVEFRVEETFQKERKSSKSFNSLHVYSQNIPYGRGPESLLVSVYFDWGLGVLDRAQVSPSTCSSFTRGPCSPGTHVTYNASEEVSSLCVRLSDSSSVRFTFPLQTLPILVNDINHPTLPTSQMQKLGST